MDNVNSSLAQLLQNLPSQDNYPPATRVYKGSRAVGATNPTTKLQFQTMMNSKCQSVFERASNAIGINPKLNSWSPTIRQPSNGEIREIHEAINNNDINKIHEMILIGIDLDSDIFNQDRPIDKIISQNKIQLIELLLTTKVLGVNNNESSSMIDIKTALVTAIEEQRFEILKLLITHINSNQNIQENILYQNLFKTAVSCGNIQIAKLLIEKTPFKINYLYDWGESALMKAISKQDCEMVKLLIEHGADINLPDTINHSPLERAVRTGNKDIAELLLQNGAKHEKFTFPTYSLEENGLAKARKDGLINQINNLTNQPNSLLQLCKNVINKSIIERHGKITKEQSIESYLGFYIPQDKVDPAISLKSVDTQDASENETLQSLELINKIPKEEIKQALPEGATLRDIIPVGVQLDYGVTEESIYSFLRQNGVHPRLIQPRKLINKIDYNSID